MISIDTAIARNFVSDEVYNESLEKCEKALVQLKDKSGEGSEWLGWRDLLKSPNDALLEKVSSLGRDIRNNGDIFIVCGIGGSYLGAKAVIDALSSHFNKKGPEILFAGHHMGGKYLQELLAYIKTPKQDGSPKSIYINVISKSGSTLETALSFRMIREVMEELYDEKAADRIICTTSSEGGVLNGLIEEKAYRKFIIPEDVGGRFSVLTPVGLIPIAVAGIDIKTLFYGAVSAFNKYEEDATDIVNYAAVRRALHEKGINRRGIKTW